MSGLIASQNNERIVLIDGTIIEVDTVLGEPVGFIIFNANPNSTRVLDEIMEKIKARYQDVPARLLIHTDGSGHIEVGGEPDEDGNTWLPYFIFTEIDELISHVNEARQ